MSATVNEQQIVEALHRLPAERWLEVLDYLTALQNQTQANGPGSIRTAANLASSELVGIWADREDIEDSRSFARRLRQEAEHRDGAS